ncbi:MAG: hypothetical protein AB1645_08995 [Bacillota bacterium]
MTRKITVEITRSGEIKADFAGFAGDDCVEEADRLAAVLARFGLSVAPAEVRRKSEAEIREELGAATTSRAGIPAAEE